MPTAHPQLTDEQVDALGRELDELRNRVRADLGERDAEYIRKVIKAQRALEISGRGLLFAGFLPPAWLGGVAALSLSKILDNMEIGHNVMHGQYDWMKDPALDSKRFEWDTACPGDQWRHSHNYMHHTHTNVLGKDRDIGYGILRMSEDQPWRPRDLGNPVYATLLALLFQWGVAVHDLEVDRIEAGETTLAEKRDILQAIWEKGRRQVLKDYVAFPLLAGPAAPFVLAGNLSANLARNVWSYMIIFCGHFPEHRYAEIATEVREICERYGLPYNTGPLHKQFGSVVKKIFRLALPGRGADAHEPDTDTRPTEHRAAQTETTALPVAV
jgi:linoleoyl-CoA desaturase